MSLKDISCNKDKKKHSKVPKINKNWGKEAGGVGVNMQLVPIAPCSLCDSWSLVHVNIRIIKGPWKSHWKLPFYFFSSACKRQRG